jgi:hypothetical protein
VLCAALSAGGRGGSVLFAEEKAVEGGHCLVEMVEVMCCVLLCMLEAVEGGFCLLEVPEVICCALLCTEYAGGCEG